jgi:hypothetical protein
VTARETSCLSLCWAVLDLFIASARGLALTALEHRQLAQMCAARMAQTPDSLTALDVPTARAVPRFSGVAGTRPPRAGSAGKRSNENLT